MADNVLTNAASARVIFTDPPDAATEVVIRIVEIMKRRGRRRVQRTVRAVPGPLFRRTVAKHATADVKIVWHGCYACNFFSEIRQAAFFKNLPLATVYGHRDIMVQAGMPWGFVRIRKAGEDDLDAVIGEVVPMSYVIKWASNEPEEHLLKTLKADEAEADVKAVVRKELAARGRAP